jgi:hypothetical protein
MARIVALGACLLSSACTYAGIQREAFTGSLEQQQPIDIAPATEPAFIETCRQAIADAARSHGAVQVAVVGTSEPSRAADGTIEAPLEAQVTYERPGELDVRKAPIVCQLNSEGRVTGLL